MAKQLAFYLNSNLCVGCKTCQMACKDKNSNELGINWRRVVTYGGGQWVKDPTHADLAFPNFVFGYSVSVACNHCQNPKCLDVCPSGAINKREDGIVLIDQNRCIGCKYCIWACPYGAPQFDEKAGVMTKCNFCYDLIDKGEDPACVDACPMRCLDFGELEELRAKYGDADAIAPLPPSNITTPSLVLTPHKHAQPSEAGMGHIENI